MGSYVIRRILQMAFVMVIVTVIVFLMVRLLPGDPILMYLSSSDMSAVSEDEVSALRHELGLDRPYIIQYFDWISDVLKGDLGTSIINRRKVSDDIVARIPITMYIGGIAFIISILIGIPFGVIAAVKHRTWIDTLLTSIGNIGITLPVFWLGILLIYFFGWKLKLLPLYGYVSPTESFMENLKYIILPVICLAIPAVASAVRMTRSSMLEVLRQDYIRTAWSKGLSERVVIFRHALKNGLIPVATLKGMSLAAIIGGSVLVETVFSIPGMGRLAVEGLFARDYAVVQGVILVIGSIVLLINLLIDLSYGWMDPRIRYY